jgi:tripartite ATP-independent transporter DctP family solute receptor
METQMKRLIIKSLLALMALSTLGFVHAQERTFKMALASPEGHPAVPGMKKFAELVAAKSNGRFKVSLFLNSALGSDQAVVSAMKGGTIELAVMNSGILASEAKELAIFDFPFLFANEKESDAIVDGPVGRKMHQLLEAKGLVGLSYWELGYRQITNSKRPITKIEDLDGLKLRVIPSPINIEWVKALGANPTPLPFPEVYGAMEQRAIDGQENPISVIAANKFWEVQKYMVISNHQYNPQSVIMSKKVWDSLSPADRKLIDDAADESTQLQRKEARAAVSANLDLVKKNGIAVTQLSSAEQDKLREKMKPVIAKFSASVGESTVNEMMAELAKLRK